MISPVTGLITARVTSSAFVARCSFAPSRRMRGGLASFAGYTRRPPVPKSQRAERARPLGREGAKEKR